MSKRAETEIWPRCSSNVSLLFSSWVCLVIVVFKCTFIHEAQPAQVGTSNKFIQRRKEGYGNKSYLYQKHFFCKSAY